MNKDDDAAVAKKRQSRKKKRNKDYSNTLCYAAISPVSYKIGQIVNINTGNNNVEGDINSGGLVFKYSDRDDQSSLKEKSIFLKHYGYNLGDIPLDGDISFLAEPSSIAIQEINVETLPIEYLMKIRQMSVFFTELTFRQIFALDKFIRENINHKQFSSINVTVELQ